MERVCKILTVRNNNRYRKECRWCILWGCLGPAPRTPTTAQQIPQGLFSSEDRTKRGSNPSSSLRGACGASRGALAQEQGGTPHTQCPCLTFCLPTVQITRLLLCKAGAWKNSPGFRIRRLPLVTMGIYCNSSHRGASPLLSVSAGTPVAHGGRADRTAFWFCSKGFVLLSTRPPP